MRAPTKALRALLMIGVAAGVAAAASPASARVIVDGAPYDTSGFNYINPADIGAVGDNQVGQWSTSWGDVTAHTGSTNPYRPGPWQQSDNAAAGSWHGDYFVVNSGGDANANDTVHEGEINIAFNSAVRVASGYYTWQTTGSEARVSWYDGSTLLDSIDLTTRSDGSLLDSLYLTEVADGTHHVTNVVMREIGNEMEIHNLYTSPNNPPAMNSTPAPTTDVPEPGAAGLLGLVTIAFGLVARRRAPGPTAAAA